MWQMEEHRSVVACSVSGFIEKWGRRPTQTELVTEAIDGEMTQFVIVSKGAPKIFLTGSAAIWRPGATVDTSCRRRCSRVTVDTS